MPHDEGLYLPSGSNVFITRTRSGKPAFARKKKSNLEDFGFDILSQTFGVPSVAEMRRRAPSRYVRQSARNYRNPFSAAAALPPQYFPAQEVFNNKGPGPEPEPEPVSDSDSEEVTLVVKKKGSNGDLTATPQGILKRPGNKGSSRNIPGSSGKGYPYSHSPGLQGHPPPPHYPYTQNGLGNVPPFPPSQPHYPYQGLSHVPGGPQQAMYTGPSTWTTQQAPLQYATSAAFPAYQPMTMPAQPIQQHPFSYAAPFMSAQPPAPPPPSLPTQPLFPGAGMPGLRGSRTGVKNDNEGHNASGVEPDTPIAADRRNRTRDRGNLNDDSNEVEDVGKRIRHYHICAGCGKRRSREYQKAHPLKRGEKPVPAYCTRCIRDANYSNTTLSDAGFAHEAKTANVSIALQKRIFFFLLTTILASSSSSQTRYEPRW